MKLHSVITPYVFTIALGFIGCGGGSADAPSAPQINLHPQSQTVLANGMANFNVAASGNPAPTFKWQRSSDEAPWVDIVDQTGVTLSFTTQPSDQGAAFRAVASNGSGSSTSNPATLTVHFPSTLTTQPAGQTVAVGWVATFGVTAIGNPATTFQWQRSSDGTTWVNLSGETHATLAFTAQETDNGAQFRVAASNGISSPAVSSPAVLSVNASPSAPLSFPLPGSVSLEMLPIPRGDFIMGSPETEVDRVADEGPQHRVTLTSFYMAKFKTTQAQWLALMGSNPSHTAGDLMLPVDWISQSRITESDGFLMKLNEATASLRPGGLVFRLPTEAEWEYAARGGTTTRYFWGDDPTYAHIGDYAWWGGNSGGRNHPVGGKAPNPYGLYDISGNAWEFCQDWYGPYTADSLTDPAGPATGTEIVSRSGGSNCGANHYREAYRVHGSRLSVSNDFSFRVVLALPRKP